MLQMTFVNCIAILSNYFGGEVKFVLVAKVNKSLTRIFSEKISECFRINTNASKTWLKYRPVRELHKYGSPDQMCDWYPLRTYGDDTDFKFLSSSIFGDVWKHPLVARKKTRKHHDATKRVAKKSNVPV